MFCVVADCEEAAPAWLPLMLTEGSIVVVVVEVLGCVRVAVLSAALMLPAALPLAEPLRLPEAEPVDELGAVALLAAVLGVWLDELKPEDDVVPAVDSLPLAAVLRSALELVADELD